MGDQPPSAPGELPRPPADRASVAAAILGVMALLIGWIPFVGLIGLGLAVAAVVAGVRGVRRSGARAPAIVGLVCGALIIALWSFGAVLLAVLVATGRLQV